MALCKANCSSFWVCPRYLKNFRTPGGGRVFRSNVLRSQSVSPHQVSAPPSILQSAVTLHLLNVIVITFHSCITAGHPEAWSFPSIAEIPWGKSRSHKFLLGFCSSLQPGISLLQARVQLLLESVGCAPLKGGSGWPAWCRGFSGSFEVPQCRRGQNPPSFSLGPDYMRFLQHNSLSLAHSE